MVRKLIGLVALLALAMPVVGASAFDETKYPDLKGQWNRRLFPGGGGGFDQAKPNGFGQQAPLTPEYTKVMQDSLADQRRGGQGNFKGYECIFFGMPMMMVAFNPVEFLVTPGTTYVLIGQVDHGRRIFTDGREWPPRDLDPTYQGYSIGRWIDEDGDGKYDVLEVETRGPFKGPRSYDTSGLPLHHDNQSIIKERIYLDKSNSDILHDEITVIDHALTRPWTVDKQYEREPNPQPDWPEFTCAEFNQHVQVGAESYMISGDGYLMPTHKDQAPPDLRYFQRQTR